LAARARIVLLAADGLPNAEIARRTGTSRPTVVDWRSRYDAGGIRALDDQPRSGRPPKIDEIDFVVVTLAADGRPPQHLGVTHWSARLLAAELGISFATVARIWRKWKLQPWRRETFKFSTDPALDAKIRDVVGLYLNPPEKAVVVCIDEKSQIQALDRTAPILPIRLGLPGEGDPRLRPPRHHHPVRRPRGGHRPDRAAVPTPTPPPGIPAVPQAGREGLPAGGTSCGVRQLRHP
jgi:transposase